MNRLLLPLTGLLLAAALCACNYVDPSLTDKTKLYTDAPVDLSELVVSVKPEGRQKAPLRALMYPFWIQQDISDSLALGKQIGQIFHSTWTRKELLPVLVLDDKLVYRSLDKCLAEARRRGADLLILGFVPYLYAGHTLDDTAVTVQVNIYETTAGQMLFSMAQSARIEYRPPKDWFVWDSVTRMPDSPMLVALTAIAEDMAEPLDSWLPPIDTGLGYAYTAQTISAGLVKAPPMPDMGFDSDLPQALSAPGTSVNIKVEFDKDQAVIKPEYYPYLDELGRALQSDQLKDKTVALAGHTDSDADPAYNLELSQKRADAVKRYLVQKFGIAPERLVTKGFGETRPLVPNDSPAHMQANRRVEVWIIQ